LVRNLTITRCSTAKGTTCSLIVITTDKYQVYKQCYIVTVIGIRPLTSSKVFLFYAGMCMFEKSCPVSIWTADVFISAVVVGGFNINFVINWNCL
jgi:hypothetical protein